MRCGTLPPAEHDSPGGPTKATLQETRTHTHRKRTMPKPHKTNTTALPSTMLCMCADNQHCNLTMRDAPKTLTSTRDYAKSKAEDKHID